MSHVDILHPPTFRSAAPSHLHVGMRVMAFVEGSVNPSRASHATKQEDR